MILNFITQKSNTIDILEYNLDMHHPLLSEVDGVSLERISPDLEEWQSSSSVSGYGTPTYQNSQYYQAYSFGEVSLIPKIFSPNNDGFEDVLTINWNFDRSDLMGSISIFNSEGVLRKVIVNNEITIENTPAHSYAFCTDTIYHEALIEKVKGVDLLYHEATFKKELSARAKETGHSTTFDAATIAKKAEVKNLLIGHFSQRYRNLDELLIEAKSVFPNTYLATDGSTFDFDTI